MKKYFVEIIDFDEGIYSDYIIVKNVNSLTAKKIYREKYIACTRLFINDEIEIIIPGEFVNCFEYKFQGDE